MTGPRVEPLAGRPVSPGDWEALVGCPEGVQLVIGGPGTGKTELLARRAAHLINSETASSDQVLAMSFSRETAADLRERITAAARRSFGELSVGTFYAFARTLVEENCRELFGTSQPPMLLTAPEQIHFIREVLSDEEPGRWPLIYRRMLHTHALAEELTDFMLRCGEQRISPEELEERAAGTPAWAALPGFYRRYLARLGAERKIDYTGLLLRANHALGAEQIIAATAARFPYVLVDEYQEATLVQVEMLRKLVRGGCHLTAVADPQQTSFSFRGAERASVSAFPETFGKEAGSPVEVMTLRTSFRVSRQVLSSAGQLVTTRAETALPAPAPHSGRVEFYVFDQEMEENDWIAGEIKRLHLTEAIPYPEIAVLTRTASAHRSLSRALEREGIPHARPGARLVDHPAVRMALDVAWAAVEDNRPGRSAENAAAVDRIMESLLLGPLFSLTQGRTRELTLARRGSGRRWWEVIAAHLPQAGRLSRLLEDPSWATTPPATDGFWKLWRRVPQFGGLIRTDRLADYRSALASFAQTLGRLAERSPGTSLLRYRALTIEGDLEASPLLPPHNPGVGEVSVSTIHRAKGRQFEVVFIAGALDGVFPDTRPYRSLLEAQFLSRSQPDHSRLRELRLEEERNLAYIAMTRARRRVVWTATSPDLNEAHRTVSRFVVVLADRAGGRLAGPDSRTDASPIGRLETESFLRRTQRDISQPLSRRLAAAAALADPPRRDLWDPRDFPGMRPPGPDRGLIDPGHVMSASQAEAYQTCPRRFALERRLRLQPPATVWLKFGLLMHSVLEKSGRRSVEGGRPGLDLPDALVEMERQIAEVDFGTPVQNAAWMERGMELLTQLAERWDFGEGEAVSFEHEVDVEAGGTRWRGRIDRIDRMGDGTLRVVDYKTSKNPMTKAKRRLLPATGLLPVGPGPGGSRLEPPLLERRTLVSPLRDGRLAAFLRPRQPGGGGGEAGGDHRGDHHRGPGSDALAAPSLQGVRPVPGPFAVPRLAGGAGGLLVMTERPSFSLSPEQQAVVDHPLAPLRVSAGAGTGKTTTVSHRIARLIAEEGLAPEQILGLTFTNKAAQELSHRIRAVLSDRVDPLREVQVNTYHGFSSQIVTPSSARLWRLNAIFPRSSAPPRPASW